MNITNVVLTRTVYNADGSVKRRTSHVDANFRTHKDAVHFIKHQMLISENWKQVAPNGWESKTEDNTVVQHYSLHNKTLLCYDINGRLAHAAVEDKVTT